MAAVSMPNTRAARDAILAALRPTHPVAAPPPPDLSSYLAGPYGHGSVGPRPDPAGLIAGYTKAATAWRAEVLHTDAAGWPQAVRAALDQRRLTRVLLGQRSDLQPDIDAALDGLAVRRFDQPLQSWKHALFDEVDAAVTSTVAGVADTGTLVLWPGPGEPRTLSLVPPVHVAVLRASRLYGSLPAAMAALLGRAPQGGLPSNLLLVSGPSKTADIQQVLAYGAHGPKELVVVLVDDTRAEQEPPQ